MTETKQCSVPGCSRAAKSRGLCQTHYMRWWKTGVTGPAAIKTPLPRGEACSIDGCDRAVYARGWCIHHYENNRLRGDPLTVGIGRGKRPNGRKWEGKTCAVEGCERPVRTAGWCTMHYDRVKRLGAPGPVGKLRAEKGKSDFIDASGYRIVSHPESGKAIAQHRLVMGQMLGRPLEANENVHHRNGKRADNRPENLELWVKSQPCGQRVVDQVSWAWQIIEKYGDYAAQETQRTLQKE